MEIDVNRNRYQGEADFTLYAMADITQYAKIPFDKFVIIIKCLSCCGERLCVSFVGLLLRCGR